MADVNITVGATLDDLLQSVESAKSTIQSFAEVVGVAFAIDKANEFVDKMGELGEQVQRTSAMLGVSTTAVQELSLAARVTGGSSDSLVLAMERLQLNLQRAQNPTSQQAAALQALGLSAKSLVGLSIDEQMRKISDAVSRFADGGNKAAAIIALIGRQGAQMIPVLDQGRVALDNLKQTADFIAVPPESIESLAKMKEASVTLGTAIENLAATITGKFAGSLTTMINKTTETVAAVKLLIENGKLLDRTLTTMAEADLAMAEAQGMISAADAATAHAKITTAQMGDLREMGLKMLTDLQSHANTTGDSFAAMWDKLFGIPEQKKQVPQLNLSLGQSMKDALADAQEQIKLADEVYRGQAEKINASVSVFKFGEAEKTAALIAAVNTRREAEEKALIDAAALMPEGSAQWKKAMDEMEIVSQKAFNDIQKATDQLVKYQEERFKSVADTISGAFTSQLRGMLSGTVTFGAALKNMFASLVTDAISYFVKMGAEWAAQQLFMLTAKKSADTAMAASTAAASAAGLPAKVASFTSDAAADAARVFGGVFAYLAPLMGPGAAGPAGAASAAALAEMMPAVPKFAVGIDYVPNDMIAMLHQGEKVTPAEENTAGGGQGGLTVNMNVSAIDANSFAQSLMDNRSHLATVIRQVMRANTSSYSRQFGGAAANFGG